MTWKMVGGWAARMGFHGGLTLGGGRIRVIYPPGDDFRRTECVERQLRKTPALGDTCRGRRSRNLLMVDGTASIPQETAVDNKAMQRFELSLEGRHGDRRLPAPRPRAAADHPCRGADGPARRRGGRPPDARVCLKRPARRAEGHAPLLLRPRLYAKTPRVPRPGGLKIHNR